MHIVTYSLWGDIVFGELVPVWAPTSSKCVLFKVGMKQGLLGPPLFDVVLSHNLWWLLLWLDFVILQWQHITAWISWIPMRLDVFTCLLVIWFPSLWRACFKSFENWIGVSWLVGVLYVILTTGAKCLFLVRDLCALSSWCPLMKKVLILMEFSLPRFSFMVGSFMTCVRSRPIPKA